MTAEVRGRFGEWSAKVIAEVFAPAVLVAAVTFAVGIASSRDVGQGLLWSLIGSVFCSFVPLWFLARGAALGHWETHHVRDRADRLVPLTVAAASVVLGLAVMYVGGAPRQLTGLVLAMLLCLALATAVTQVWKISMHAAISAGVVGMLAVTFGPWMLLGLVAVVLVAWSRVFTGDHTVSQVVAGGLLGLVFGGALYALLA